jgi:hypothetical protein
LPSVWPTETIGAALFYGKFPPQEDRSLPCELWLQPLARHHLLSLSQYFQRTASSMGAALPAIAVASLAKLEAAPPNRQRYSID